MKKSEVLAALGVGAELIFWETKRIEAAASSSPDTFTPVHRFLLPSPPHSSRHLLFTGSLYSRGGTQMTHGSLEKGSQNAPTSKTLYPETVPCAPSKPADDSAGKGSDGASLLPVILFIFVSCLGSAGVILTAETRTLRFRGSGAHLWPPSSWPSR